VIPPVPFGGLGAVPVPFAFGAVLLEAADSPIVIPEAPPTFVVCPEVSVVIPDSPPTFVPPP